jgi:hypothetical protein
MSVPLYADTIEDIRTNTGWQPSLHQPRVFSLTPAELIACLNKYNKDVVKIEVLFNRVSTKGLNKWICVDGTKRRWESKRYVSFEVKDIKQKHLCKDLYLFINKANPDSGLLFNLTKGSPINVTGRVKNTANGKAWIDVIKIEQA